MVYVSFCYLCRVSCYASRKWSLLTLWPKYEIANFYTYQNENLQAYRTLNGGQSYMSFIKKKKGVPKIIVKFRRSIFRNFDKYDNQFWRTTSVAPRYADSNDTKQVKKKKNSTDQFDFQKIVSHFSPSADHRKFYINFFQRILYHSKALVLADLMMCVSIHESRLLQSSDDNNVGMSKNTKSLITQS